MPKILIVHGAGMNMRGKVQTEIFGPMTLAEYDERIRGYAAELGLDIEIFHSNIEGEVVNKFYAAHDRGVDAALFNPAGVFPGLSRIGGGDRAGRGFRRSRCTSRTRCGAGRCRRRPRSARA